jgi:two-component system, NtrC family, response regulator AtoC
MIDPTESGLNVLVADDEPTIRLTIGETLRSHGHRVTWAANGAEALDRIHDTVFDVVVTDVRMPRLDGLTLFRKIRELAPDTKVIIITAYGDVSEAVTTLKEGAVDYLTKPCNLEEIAVRVDRLAERRKLERELSAARRELAARSPGSVIVGRSPPIARMLGLVETMAQSDAPLLISGESGTGKELVARTIHSTGPRADKPFITVNCAAFPETLLEAELFGHEKGAFTGAVRAREGRFEAAAGGTLFLDEIGEIPLLAQAKLLRVVEEGVVEPLGTNRRVPIDVRLISATHRNLRERIEAGAFREDLFYRLNVLEIAIPPLRDRRGDLPILVEHFLAKLTPAGKSLPTLSPRAWAALSDHSYPGNVRELQHAVERAVVLARGAEIDLQHLPDDIGHSHSGGAQHAAVVRPLSVAVAEFEREYLLRALEHTHGKKAKAAEQLGISRKNLWEKLRSHGL